MTLGLCSLSKEYLFHYLDDSYILYFSQRSLNKFKLRNPYNSSILCVFDSTTESDWCFVFLFFNKMITIITDSDIALCLKHWASWSLYSTYLPGPTQVHLIDFIRLLWQEEKVWNGFGGEKKQFVAIVASRVYKRGNGKYKWKPVCSVVNSSVVVLERCYSEQGQDLRK